MTQVSLVHLRRDFLRYVAIASSFAVGYPVLGLQKRKMPEPPSPADADNTKTTAEQMSQRAQLKLNEKEFRESLASLHQRVSELKQDMDAMHTADIFSLKVYKQTGEIEHLAKKLRSLAKI